MRVAHFLSFGIGGADRAAIELVRNLIGTGVDVTILYNKMSFPMKTADQDVDQELLSTFSEARKLAPHLHIDSVDKIEDLGFDLLHVHRSGEDEWLLPGLGTGKRSYKIIETNFHGANLTIADYRIYPSHALMKYKGIKLDEKSAVIPNIVNSIQGSSKKQYFGISDRTKVFGRIGRSDRSIYSSVLLKEYARIENENTLLIWVGKSKLATDDAQKFGIKNIYWLDPIDNPQEIANLYQTFDIYLHVNALGETFGNTVAEAVIRGIPVASLKGTRKYPQAQAELLDHSQFCTSRRQFRNLLKKYFSDDEFCEIISNRNLEFGKDMLDKTVITNKVLNLYEKLL